MNFPSFESFSGGDPAAGASPSSLSVVTRAIYDCFRPPTHAMARAPRDQVGDTAATAGADRALGLAVFPRHLARAGRRGAGAAARPGRAPRDRLSPDAGAHAGGADPDPARVLRPSRLLRSRPAPRAAAAIAGPPGRPREPRSLRRALRADLVGDHPHRRLSGAAGRVA